MHRFNDDAERPLFCLPSLHGQVPVMREIVTGQLSSICFFESPAKLFQQALKLLQSSQAVGFPEGTKPMVQFTKPS